MALTPTPTLDQGQGLIPTLDRVLVSLSLLLALVLLLALGLALVRGPPRISWWLGTVSWIRTLGPRRFLGGQGGVRGVRGCLWVCLRGGGGQGGVRGCIRGCVRGGYETLQGEC